MEDCSNITLFSGNGIASTAWTSNSGAQPQGTQGTTDTYTITYDNGSTTTFVVTNGANGTIGTQGNYGGYSSEWLFDNGTGAGTSVGDFRFDNATLASVTGIYINETNADSTDLTAFLAGMNNSGDFGVIRISKKSDSNVFWMGVITATDDTGGSPPGSEHYITLTHVASNGSFTNDDPCVVSYVNNGAVGQGIDHTSFTSSDVAPFNIASLLGANDTYTIWGDVGETINLGTFIVQNAPARIYSVYSAVLTQTGTGAPVATILENTLGTVTWSRPGGAGQYIATTSGLFVSAKTMVFIHNDAWINQKCTISAVPANANQVYVDSFDSSFTAADDLIKATSIEIRVYP